MAYEKYENLEYYWTHPRLLELKFSEFFNHLRAEFPYNSVIGLFRGLSTAFNCNWTAIKGVIDNLHEIDKIRVKDWLRYRQEKIFLGYLNGKTNYEIAKEIGVSPNNLYSKRYPYKVHQFADEMWLEKLDDSVTLAGIPQYAKEISKFVAGLESVKEAL
jgi:hypothetical protein